MKSYYVKFTIKKVLMYSVFVQDAENKNHAVFQAFNTLNPNIWISFGHGLKIKAYKLK